ncbi:MAG: ABC transporter ATP-binding protein [Pseudomonadota bacterium]
MNASPVIEISDVSFSYGSQSILQDVNLTVMPGDFIAMIGPNGGGKTTLLKLILGLLKPRKGLIEVMGRAPQAASHRIGYVPQDVHINASFPITVMDVVLMGKLSPKKRFTPTTADDRRDAMDTLARMGMAQKAQQRIGALSGGQRQRVFIARALVARPSLLLLDEPTASIDTKGQASFYRLLETLNADITIVVVSHDLLVVSSYVKSVACVNRRLHHHHQAEITGDMLESMYPCTVEDTCPVELVAHGLPHRVLMPHREESDD